MSTERVLSPRPARGAVRRAIQARRRERGRAIREIREGLQLTRAELAAALGVTPQAVGGWERGDVTPGLERWEQLQAMASTPDAPAPPAA